MKLTKQRLKEIIKEELGDLREGKIARDYAVALGKVGQIVQILKKEADPQGGQGVEIPQGQRIQPRYAAELAEGLEKGLALFPTPEEVASIEGKSEPLPQRKSEPLPQRPLLGTPLRWLGDVEEAIQSGGKLPKPDA